jgi:hypothetical protein
MKKPALKLLSFTIAILFVILMMPMQRASASTTTDGKFYYEVSGSNATITGLVDRNISGSLEIPDTINDGTSTYAVTSVGNTAFSGCTGLTIVTIPDSVTTIGSSAFSGCTGLETINALPATAPVTSSGMFSGVPSTVVLYTPSGATGYDVAPWTQFEQVVVPNYEQAAPTELKGVASTTFGGSDGKITGTTSSMEYRLSTETSYKAVAGTEITGLASGTYKVRYAAKTGYNAGADAVVVVTNGPNGNLAAGKVPTASSSAFKDLSLVTDGIKSSSIYADGYPDKGIQWIQMNLGTSQDVNNIKLWHYFDDARKYHDVIVQLSDDPTFSTGFVTTVFNNDTDNSAGLGLGKDSEYTETSSGLNITFNSVNARYVRFYSNGSTANEWNHYVEVEIYGGQTQTGNLAADKSVTSSTNFKNISRITDSNMDTDSYSDGYPTQGLQWVQIDLGASRDVSNIKLLHYYGDARKYHDVIIQLSDDPAFSTGVVTTVFNNDTDNSAGLGLGKDSEYAETSSGLNITFNKVHARYARFYSNGSTANNWNHYVEIEIYGGQTQTGNLAAGKSVTSSSNFTDISRITDVNMDTGNYSDGYPNQGLQWVQIDLGASQDVSNIKLLHYFGDARKYHDVIVQLSNDSTFKTGVTTVFNNDTNNNAGLGLGAGTDSEYSETISGKDLSFGSVNARYVRFYSNGSTANAWNHYVEVEVYGSSN